MTEEEVGRVVERTMAAFFEDKERVCRCSLDMKVHQEHHQFLGELIGTANKWSKVKWGVIQWSAIAIASLILALFGYGALMRVVAVVVKQSGGGQ